MTKDDDLRFHITFKGIGNRSVMESIKETAPCMYKNLDPDLEITDDSRVYFRDSTWEFGVRLKEMRELCNKEDIEVLVITVWGDEHRTIKDISRTMFHWFKKKEDYEQREVI